jgi:Fe(3+) dicitrate transport protein
MRRRLLLALPLGIVLLARGAYAQMPDPAASAPAEPATGGVASEPAAAPEEPRAVEVHVIGNRADSLQRVAGSGTLITAKDLKRAQPVDTAEMLRRVPGIQVRQEYSGGSRIDISIRGLESGRSRRVLLLEDGIPIALNPYAEPDMNYAPAIERYRGIEVVKGSGNILFGPQTLAGTINFLTIAPPDHQMAAVDVDAGNYGYVRTLATYGDTVGDARYVVQLLDRRGDGFRDQPFNSIDGLAKVAFPTNKDGEAVVKLGFHRDDAASDDIGLTRAMFRQSPRRTTLSPDAHLVLNNYNASLTHEQRFSEKTKLKVLVYGYITDRIWRRPDFQRAPAPGETYDRIVGDVNTPGGALYFKHTGTVLDRSYDVMGVEPRFEHRMSTGSVEHVFDFGGRVLRETAHYGQRTTSYPESYAGTNDFEQNRSGMAFAGYVQDRIAFRDDILVTPGIRVEHLALRTAVLRQPGLGDTYDAASQQVAGVIPGIGMVVGSKTANLFGGVHFGYAPPRVTSAISARGASKQLQGDQSIDYELGSRVMPAKWVRLEATGFLSNFNNQVVVNTSPGADTNLTDAGATNIYGVEAGTLVAIDKLLKLGTVVELGARYTFSRATFRYGNFAGNVLPYAPQHAFNANFDVEHSSGIGGQIAYAYVSEQFTDALNTRAEDVAGLIGVIDPHHIVDTTVHYRHKPSGITLRLTAKNLLDSTYVTARRPEGIFPGAYRQVIVGLRWDWEREAPKKEP